MNTLNQVLVLFLQKKLGARIEAAKIPNDNPQNMEEWVLANVGRELYEIFIKGYTQKQWG